MKSSLTNRNFQRTFQRLNTTIVSFAECPFRKMSSLHFLFMKDITILTAK